LGRSQYQRNIEIATGAVIGAAEEMILNGVSVADATSNVKAAQESVTAVSRIFKDVGSIVSELLKNYPGESLIDAIISASCSCVNGLLSFVMVHAAPPGSSA
jgi:hypothetical protein